MTDAIQRNPNYAFFKGEGYRRILYEHGLPFSQKLGENLDGLALRIKRKKASLLVIDGGVGEGKTTLAVHVAEYFQKAPLDFRRQLAMGGVEFQEKLQMCIDSGLKVIIYDEAGDFNKRGALTAFNQQLNRVFETYRTFGILVILVLPSFGILDNSLFEKQIARMLLHCEGRTQTQGNFRGYSLYRMFYLRKKMQDLVVPPHAYGQTFPNFYGHFLDMSPKRSLELEKVSTEGKKQVLSDNIIKNRGLLDPVEIGRKIGRTKQWVNRVIKELGLKPATQYKRKRYFDKDAQIKIENY